jgi:hypothetical protein
VPRVFVSARSGECLDTLRAQIVQALLGDAPAADALNAVPAPVDAGMGAEPGDSIDEEGEDLRDGTYHSVA